MNDEQSFPKGKSKIRIRRNCLMKICRISDLQKTVGF